MKRKNRKRHKIEGAFPIIESVKDVLVFLTQFPITLLIGLLYSLPLFPLIFWEFWNFPLDVLDWKPHHYLFFSFLVFISAGIAVPIVGGILNLVYKAKKDKKLAIRESISIAVLQAKDVFLTILLLLFLILLPIIIFTAINVAIVLIKPEFRILLEEPPLPLLIPILISVPLMGSLIIVFRAKFSLTLPNLMLGSKSIIQSVKESWNQTRDRELSIILAFILLALISAPLIIIDFLITLIFGIYSLIYFSIVFFLSDIFSTLLYLNLTKVK